MQLYDEAWAAIRMAYADPDLSLTDIAARFGTTPQRIGARARKDGWKARQPTQTARPRTDTSGSDKPATAKSKAGAPAKADTPKVEASVEASALSPPRPAALPTAKARKTLVARLYRAISLKLEHMEKRMASGKPRSAQDEERESRALATLIGNFEKVTEAVAELDRDNANARAAGRAGTDAERMRREIADRLERLGGAGAAEPRPRKPRS